MGCGQSAMPRPATNSQRPDADEFLDWGFDTPVAKKKSPVSSAQSQSRLEQRTSPNEGYGGRSSAASAAAYRRRGSSTFHGGSPRVSTSQLLGLKEPSPRSITPSTISSNQHYYNAPTPRYYRSPSPTASVSSRGGRLYGYGGCSPMVAGTPRSRGARPRVESRNLGINAAYSVRAVVPAAQAA
ncbi:hypothetical protein FOL47_005280 [Perkinsus chesapeaki]|uniref:Uncharacterized protein n=1 Tax=Perkinsus chesapeaki TaxID=330153 RepID=A0A7J6LXY9_PERCH|nr:hypothetical protein FOL47_005280 [Perkinsus chesapeaki]